MHFLLLDNIDSFTYNIVHYLEALDVEVTVVTNTEIDPKTVEHYEALVISPGPGLPKEAGKLMETLGEAIKNGVPVLGICLGMQAIAEYFGGTIYNQETVKHGQQVVIGHDDSPPLSDLPRKFQVGLYHSWAVSPELPEYLTATAFSEEGVMMALRHVNAEIYGVQFHPESIMTEHGMQIFENFIKLI
jgi:anthranilate synthase component II